MVSENSSRLASVKFFYKKLPSDVTDDELRRYDITRESYLQAFNERADKGVISKEAFNRFLESSPKKKELKRSSRHRSRRGLMLSCYMEFFKVFYFIVGAHFIRKRIVMTGKDNFILW